MKTNSKVNYKKGMVAATVATLLATYGVTTVGATTNIEELNVNDSINAVIEETTVTEDAVVEEDVVEEVNTDVLDVTQEVIATEETPSPSEEVVVVAENTRSREVLPGTLWDYLPLGDYFHDEKNIAICSEIGGTTYYMVEIMKDDSMEIIQTFESKILPTFSTIDGVSYFVVNAGNGYEVLSITIDGVTSRVPFKNGADTPARDVTKSVSVDGHLFVASLGELDYNGLGITYVSEYGSDLTYKGSYAIAPTVIDPIHFVDYVNIVGGKVVITANGKEFTFDRVSGGETEKPPVDNGGDNNGGDNNGNNGGDNNGGETEKPPVDGGDNNGGETEKPPVDNGEDNGTEKPPVDNGGDQDNNGGNNNGEDNGTEKPPVDNGNQDNNGSTDGNQDNNGSTDGNQDNNGSTDGNQDNNGNQDTQKPDVPVNPSKPNDNTTNNGTNNGTGNGSTQNVPTLPQTGQLPVGAFAGLASIFSGLGLFIKSKRK